MPGCGRAASYKQHIAASLSARLASWGAPGLPMCYKPSPCRDRLLILHSTYPCSRVGRSTSPVCHEQSLKSSRQSRGSRRSCVSAIASPPQVTRYSLQNHARRCQGPGSTAGRRYGGGGSGAACRPAPLPAAVYGMVAAQRIPEAARSPGSAGAFQGGERRRLVADWSMLNRSLVLLQAPLRARSRCRLPPSTHRPACAR